jgi:hypothetical protein
MAGWKRGFVVQQRPRQATIPVRLPVITESGRAMANCHHSILGSLQQRIVLT